MTASEIRDRIDQIRQLAVMAKTEKEIDIYLEQLMSLRKKLEALYDEAVEVELKKMFG